MPGFRSKSNAVLAGFLILAMLLGCGYLVYVTGGTRGPYPHTLYVPIALGAYRFGFVGGILTAVAAGLVVGPTMPLNVGTTEPQTLSSWLYRLVFYALAGGVFGATAGALRQRRDDAIRAFRTLEASHAATLKAFTSVLETYDDDTGEHCGRVAANAKAFGEELDLPESQLNRLYWAGILHDVGKVAVPQRILQKPSSLDSAEFDIVRRHPTFGAELLRGISDTFEEVAVGVESHHERWDGRGYPSGLSGHDIPLAGRILAIVDSFEAMTADRPYRRSRSGDEALGELLKGSGSQYDPDLVPIYERLYRNDRLQIAGQQYEESSHPVSPAIFADYRDLN